MAKFAELVIGEVRRIHQRVKNSFALSCAPSSGTEYVVSVVFWTCFRALLESRPGRQPLFQHAGRLVEVQLPRIPLPGTWVNKLALGRSWRLSDRARDRDHSNPESPWATLSLWNPGRRSEASESVEARR